MLAAGDLCTYAAFVGPNVVAWANILAAACLTKGRPTRRRAGVAFGALALLPPCAIPDGFPLVRGVSALIAFVGTMRLVDLRSGEWTLRQRLAHVVSVIDTRRLVRVPSRFDGRIAAVGVAWLASALAGFWLLTAGAAPARDAVGFWLARWGSALMLVYGAVSAGYALGRVGYAALGWETGPQHVAPILSRSVQELWGERWARPVSIWLRETFFRPWARRRRPGVGLLLGFAVSAGFHAYAVWVALGLVAGLPMAGLMLLYFLLQALAVGLEQVARVRRWPAWGGHAWTVAWMTLTAPVFLEPMVRVLGVAPP
jgi:hypothetical protein